MDEMVLQELIRRVVVESTANADGETRYRSPIVGFAPVDVDEFYRLRELVPGHMMPEQLLTGARSLVSYFLPFSREIVAANARSPYVAREWAVAYVETNRLLSRISDELIGVLAAHGVRAAAEAPTHVFDKKMLMARWSHKSVAYMTGIGSFGLHRMVITDAGCAGRFGSIVVDAECGSGDVLHSERCLYFHNGSCALCVQRCPVSALGTDGSFERARCYQHLTEMDAYFSDLPLTDVCGKCAVGLPCSLTNPVRK